MRQAGFRDVLAVREFRALWVADLLSLAGSQLARVGLAVLVYSRTGSAGWTALAYVLTFLPALVGWGSLVDRIPRRGLIVGVDLVRAVLAGLMVLPVPLPVLFVLVFLVAAGGAPVTAAQQSLIRAILGDRYVAGLAVRTVTSQVAQVGGFLLAGALLTVFDPRLVLGVNAVTFVVAAVVVWTGIGARPTVARPGRGPAAR